MGSPVTETERKAADNSDAENRHRRRIDRTFAIGMREVSIAQFEAFQPNHNFNRTTCRESDAPANMISWYDAAAFCNWLREQEGIPAEQWCYDRNQPISEGMTLYPDFLQRTGYRLPTEAEWEYACRVGTTTSRFYGETETLLGETHAQAYFLRSFALPQLPSPRVTFLRAIHLVG